jgi:transposase
LKRLLIHAGGFNLGLVMRHLIGIGTPRGLQGRVAALVSTLFAFIRVAWRRSVSLCRSCRPIAALRGSLASSAMLLIKSSTTATYATGC